MKKKKGTGRDKNMKNKKLTILCDFDNTIGNSIKAIYTIYKKETKDSAIPLHYNCGWNFEGLLPTTYVPRAIQLFHEQIFYDELEAFDNCIEVLERLSHKHEVVICTVHNPISVYMKDVWIKNNLPFIKRVVYLRQDGYDKSIVKADVRVDDRVDCLLANDNSFKLLYGSYGYNQYESLSDELKKKLHSKENGTILRVNNWLEVEKFINSLQ